MQWPYTLPTEPSSLESILVKINNHLPNNIFTEDENDRLLRAPLTFLGISVGKFEDQSDSKKNKKILDYFNVGASKEIEKTTTKIKDDVADENLKHNATTVVKGNEKNAGKEYILQKYFQISTKSEEDAKSENCINNRTVPVIEANLLEQESFFAKMLKGSSNPNNPALSNSGIEAIAKPISIIGDLNKCGEDSNDTEYSGSTINNEINRSIALFEDDPQDVTRVSNIRELLNSTVNANSALDNNETNDAGYPQNQRDSPNNETETFDCSYCGKTIALDMFEEHSDYHLALVLRDKEREIARRENRNNTVNIIPKGNKRKRNTIESNTNKSETSITNFLVKIDDSIATEICSECGNKVPLQKFTEHLDFHEAQKLSRELNRKTPLVTGSNVKRKKRRISPIKKLKVPCKSIDSFFK